MVRSAPQVSFTSASVDYGTIDVADSGTTQTYDVYLHGSSTYFANAINMSVSLNPDANADEVQSESWVWVSTTLTGAKVAISSVNLKEASIGSVIAGRSGPGATSVHVRTNIIVPSGATTAGLVSFYLHHRYQYTGDDD